MSVQNSSRKEYIKTTEKEILYSLYRITVFFRLFDGSRNLWRLQTSLVTFFSSIFFLLLNAFIYTGKYVLNVLSLSGSYISAFFLMWFQLVIKKNLIFWTCFQYFLSVNSLEEEDELVIGCLIQAVSDREIYSAVS